MKIWILLGLSLLIPFFGFSQGEFNNWYFGTNAGVSFNTGIPVPFFTSAMSGSWGGSSNVSDSLGNILFYTNGFYIYNRNNVQMPNGISPVNTCTGNYYKLCIAFQKLENFSKYWVFIAGCGDPNNLSGLHYSIVDMTLNGGLGDVSNLENGITVSGTEDAFAAVDATRQHNNRDVWVCVRRRNTTYNNYLTYSVTAAGLNTTPVVSNSHIQEYTIPTTSPLIRYLKFSRDGTKLIAIYDTVAELCSFNSTTGQITPKFIVLLPFCGFSHIRPKSAEFSIDSRYLYISGSGNGGCTTYYAYLYQFDASLNDSAQFENSIILLSHEVNTAGLQMAPDEKIYCSTGSVDSLSVINNPSLQGLACSYQRDVVGLGGKASGTSLPDFVERYYAIIHHTGDCVGQLISFNPAIWPPVDSIHWDFGEPSSGGSNYSNLTTPTHAYSTTGTYTIKMFVRHNDHRIDSAQQQITIVPGLQVNAGPDQIVCPGDSATFDAGSCAGCSYAWRDASSGIMVCNTRVFKTNLPGGYIVTVTDPNGCPGKDTVHISNTLVPVIINNPLTKTICSGESTGINLLSNVPGTFFLWTAALTSGTVTGFSADSGTIINQTLINNGTLPGIVTYHITPRVGNCYGNAIYFIVTVNPGATVGITINSSANNVCVGALVTFTAVPINGGTSPIFLWKVNGTNAGTNNSTFSYNPLNGDLVSCILTSSQTSCIAGNPATSNVIIMVVNPILSVSVSIVASQNPSCQGSTVNFTASPIHGGTVPSFQWKVNGINSGTNSPSYSYIPNNGDIITCLLTSNIACPVGNPATSNSITMIVNLGSLAGITIIANPNPFCPGSSVTFTATPVNGGTNPTYQWKVNGVNTGTNSTTFISNPAPNDSVTCVMISYLTCVSGNPAISNKIILDGSLAPYVCFVACFDTITTNNAKPIKLKGGIPLGGTYSGAGVSGGYYHPNVAGVGTHLITYTYTNATLCSASKTSRIYQFASSPFICGNDFTDIRDNRKYKTVKLGSQCWFVENLNYGIEIPSTQHQRDNCINEKYPNPSSILYPLSFVYQWDEMMQYDDTPGLKGLCPPSWHVPTEAEWNTLFANWTNNGFAGSPLKYSGYSGFNALLEGVNHFNRQWDYQDLAAFFWSSTAYGPYKAWAHGMNDYDPSISVYPSSRQNAFSVRCLKD